MVLLGVLTFTNVFVVLEQPQFENYPYVKAHSSWSEIYDLWFIDFVDKMLYVAIGAVVGLEPGDEDPTILSTGKFLFILAVIINTIIFMNLLLAVVGNTYTVVTD